MLDKNDWVLFDNNSPGYVAKRRNELSAQRGVKFGAGNWRSIWLVGGNFLEYEEACRLHEDAYFEYFKKRPGLLDHLL